MIEEFILHSQTQKFKKLVLLSQDEIRKVSSSHERIGMSFSGGKDSTCMLDLCLTSGVNKEKFVPIMFDSGGIWQSTFDLIQSLEKKYKTKIILQPSDFGYIDCWEKILLDNTPFSDSFLNEVIIYKNAIKAKKNHGLDCSFVGIRADESRTRSIRFKQYENHRYTQKTGIYQFAPLEKWTKKDVWAYLLSNNIPYNNVYHQFAEYFGGNFYDYRVDSYLEPISIYKGSIKILQRYYPSDFAKITRYLQKMNFYA
jgi:phosphoadenosine phosphosulfate reductase